MIKSWEFKNLTFSFMKREELVKIVKILQNSEVEKYLYFAPITLDGFNSFAIPIIEGQEKAFQNGNYPDSATFTIIENAELLGVCGIAKMEDAHNTSNIGYQLKHSAWGKGVGTTSLEFLIDYAKKYLKVRKLFGDCMSGNIASIKVLEKCGFTFEGVIKEKYEVNGELLDNHWYGLRLNKTS